MNKLKLLWLLIIVTPITAFSYFCWPRAGVTMVASVSSDGNYAVTSDMGKFLILWDLQNHKHKIISRNANIYSAYFIKNSNKFIWQDLRDNVHVQDINGKEFLKFHSFPTYGQVMTSDLKNYFSCNQNLDIFMGYGEHQHMLLTNGDQGGFLGSGKLLNFTLSNDNKFLLTAGEGGFRHQTELDNDDGVTLWQADNGKAITKLPGNISKTFATLSPDEKYVVSGDEGGQSFIWNIETDKRMRVSSTLYHLPKDFINYETGYNSNGQIVAVKFIDQQGDYLRFTTYVPYSILYSINNLDPLKYLPLGQNPVPSVMDYTRDQSIDTAPAANILVTGQAYHNGIIVYHFDPKKQTLEKVWVGNL
jgi:WD40 repeat protein